jgi:hypothetical protein
LEFVRKEKKKLMRKKEKQISAHFISGKTANTANECSNLFIQQAVSFVSQLTVGNNLRDFAAC